MSKTKTEEKNSPSTQLGEAMRNDIKASDRQIGFPVVHQGMALADCPTNLDLTTPKGKAYAFNALGESDYQIDATEPTKIRATSYLVYPGESVDEKTGEIKQFAWIVLFDSQGKFVKTTSEVVAKRIHSALKMYSESDWQSGIPLVVYPVLNKAKTKTYHAVRIDVEAYANM